VDCLRKSRRAHSHAAANKNAAPKDGVSKL